MLNAHSIHPANSLIPGQAVPIGADTCPQRLRRRAYTVTFVIALLVAVTALGVIGAASWMLKILIGGAGAVVLFKITQGTGDKALTR